MVNRLKLNEKTVREAENLGRDYQIFDTDVRGFSITIYPSGNRAFTLDYRIAGRQRRMTIGRWPEWNTTAARERAKELRRDIDEGIDPLSLRETSREAPRVNDMITRYLAEHTPHLAARNAADQHTIMHKLVASDWGKKLVTEITKADVEKLLTKIAAGRARPSKAKPNNRARKLQGPKPTPVRANRVGEVLRKMFTLAIGWGMLTDNPASGFRRRIENERERFLTPEEIGRLPRIDPITKRQLPTRYILGFEEGFAPHDPEPCPETGHGFLLFGHDIETASEITASSANPAEPCPEIAHGNPQEPVSGFCPDPCPENAESRVRNPDTNLVREPLSKPVKEEEEDAAAREAEFDRFFAELLATLGFAANATLPAWWQGWPARTHVRRWIDDIGLSRKRIIEVALETRTDHPNPPDGPKALDRFMERAAQRDAQTAVANAKGPRSKRRRKREDPPRLSDDEKAAFYAKMVNADGFLPVSAINNSIRDLMLVRGLVTPERLRLRGVR